jgi:formate-dependent nitrite reductase membrane component NrfD
MLGMLFMGIGVVIDDHDMPSRELRILLLVASVPLVPQMIENLEPSHVTLVGYTGVVVAAVHVIPFVEYRILPADVRRVPA